MKKIRLTSCVIISLIFLILPGLFGQTPHFQWSLSYGGSDDDYPAEILVLEDGYLIGGHTKSFGNQNDKYDFYLIRTDEMGNILWSETYGGGLNEQMSSLRQTQDGGYIMSGFTQTWAQGIADGWIVRVNREGDTLWTRHYGGLTTDQFYCGVPTTDQGFIFSGFSSVYLKGDQLYVVKTDAGGDTLWTQTEGGDNQDYGVCILEAEGGGYASVGHTWSQGNESMGYLVRMNPSGHVTWWNAFGDAGEDYCRWFDQNADRSFTIVGSTQSYGYGLDDFWLVFTNVDGTPTHWYTYGGGSSEVAVNASRDTDGGILIAGNTWSFGVEAPDMYFMKTTAAGDSVWALSWGDEDMEYAFDIKPTFDGGYVVLGRDYSISTGDNNIVLLKYGPNPSIYNKLQYHHNRDLPIEDNETTLDTMLVAVAPNSTVIGVMVYIDTVMHGEIRDLIFTLTHDGVTDTLMAHPEAGGANILNAVLHPAASCDIQAGIAPFHGIYCPMRSTAMFHGLSANGTWELRIHDTQTGNTGTLEAWGLRILYETAVGIDEKPGFNERESSLVVYPNPASRTINCKYRILERSGNPDLSGQNTELTISLLDILGRQVEFSDIPAGQSQISINVSGYTPGAYFVVLRKGLDVLGKEKVVIY